MFINGIQLLTIKVRVKNSFPFSKIDLLNKNGEFWVTDSKVQSNKVISYAGLDCDSTRELIKKFTDIMLQYKHDEIDKGHKEHVQVYFPVPDDYEFPW